jgi:protein SCO1/2
MRPEAKRANTMGRNKLYLTAFVVTLASVVAAGFWWVASNQSDDQFARCRSSVVAGGAGSIGGEFTLMDETGKIVTDQEVFSRPALVYFGYTFCPDVCPLDVARNADAIDIMQERGFNIRPVFISIDPERDTPEVLVEYTDFLHPDMLGLTGTAKQVKAASLAYKTYYKKQDDEEFYLMDHSSFSYLVLPEVGFQEFFSRDKTADEIADASACFLDKIG